MTPERFDRECSAHPGAHRVVQWGGARVWKVGPRVFAIGAIHDTAGLSISMKVTPIAFEALRDAGGFRPAPYLASRGLSWLQALPGRADDEEIASMIAISYRLVASGLPGKMRRDLGLAS